MKNRKSEPRKFKGRHPKDAHHMANLDDSNGLQMAIYVLRQDYPNRTDAYITLKAVTRMPRPYKGNFELTYLPYEGRFVTRKDYKTALEHGEKDLLDAIESVLRRFIAAGHLRDVPVTNRSVTRYSEALDPHHAT